VAFSVPDFPLVVNVFTGPWLAKVSRGTVLGNLAAGKRTNEMELQYSVNLTAGQLSGQVVLLLPPLTDVRGNPLYPVSDIVEVPAGSGRWYKVRIVEDFGKGFPNEHRGAWIVQISSTVDPVEFAGLSWPVPMT
jgi:hypothetical protein